MGVVWVPLRSLVDERRDFGCGSSTSCQALLLSEALSSAPPVAAPEMISGPTLDDPHGHGEAADWCRSLSAMFPLFT